MCIRDEISRNLELKKTEVKIYTYTFRIRTQNTQSELRRERKEDK